MTALCCLVKHFRCLNYSTATVVSMLVTGFTYQNTVLLKCNRIGRGGGEE